MSDSDSLTQLGSLDFNDELKSTFDHIVEACPKFRILLVGRSGVGKSALINAVFGSGVVMEEHGLKAGVVRDINNEFVLPNNPRLVFHDSQGFSHGDGQNFETVLKFIKDRSEQENLEDRLHMIWLCTELPAYGGSLFEVAEEEILNSSGLNVPIIAVFTKFDKSVNKIKRGLPKRGAEDIIARKRAKEKFRAEYAEALSSIPKTIPCVEVSVRSGFSDTLEELVKLTEKEVKGTMSYIWASSQHPNVNLKIEKSIEIGRKKYWMGLSTSLSFPGNTLTKWLDVVLRDIIACWGFDDPQHLLRSNLFKKKITSLQEDLLDDDSAKTPLGKVTLGTTATAAGIISGLIPPAAPFAVPIAAGLVFAAWVYQVYLTTPQVIRALMGYIVDLTIVMQSLFWVTRAHAQAMSKEHGGQMATVPLSKQLVELAFAAYATDEHSSAVHDEIREFVKRAVALKPDIVLERIVELITSHRFQPAKRSESDANAVRGRNVENVNWETGQAA
ncbi:G domain-containing protein [Mycena venus]|uniref:G domain-containing protein n=1 Tax=Mycena venus TaxID=2733690 RepID=A0A8H6Z4X6_9AGAR|nr:G domain-containing protein [Mycena venus]